MHELEVRKIYWYRLVQYHPARISPASHDSAITRPVAYAKMMSHSLSLSKVAKSRDGKVGRKTFFYYQRRPTRLFGLGDNVNDPEASSR